MSAIVEFYVYDNRTYRAELDDGRLTIEFNTVYCQLYNCKLGGGGHVLNPYGIINDGMVELMYYSNDYDF